MAKKTYIGINDTPKKVKKIYIGIDNVSKKVKKAYIGVNGVAKLIFSALASGGKIWIRSTASSSNFSTVDFSNEY